MILRHGAVVIGVEKEEEIVDLLLELPARVGLPDLLPVLQGLEHVRGGGDIEVLRHGPLMPHEGLVRHDPVAVGG